MAPANPGVIAGTEQAPERHNPLRDPRDRRIPRVAGPCVLIMFGVTGDLARKKLMPAIYDLANRGLLPPGFSFVGFARRDWENEDFAQLTYQAVKEYARKHPHSMGAWSPTSKTSVATMGHDDFFSNEKSVTVPAATTIRIEFVPAPAPAGASPEAIAKAAHRTRAKEQKDVGPRQRRRMLGPHDGGRQG